MKLNPANTPYQRHYDVVLVAFSLTTTSDWRRMLTGKQKTWNNVEFWWKRQFLIYCFFGVCIRQVNEQFKAEFLQRVPTFVFAVHFTEPPKVVSQSCVLLSKERWYRGGVVYTVELDVMSTLGGKLVWLRYSGAVVYKVEVDVISSLGVKHGWLVATNLSGVDDLLK